MRGGGQYGEYVMRPAITLSPLPRQPCGGIHNGGGRPLVRRELSPSSPDPRNPCPASSFPSKSLHIRDHATCANLLQIRYRPAARIVCESVTSPFPPFFLANLRPDHPR